MEWGIGILETKEAFGKDASTLDSRPGNSQCLQVLPDIESLLTESARDNPQDRRGSRCDRDGESDEIGVRCWQVSIVARSFKYIQKVANESGLVGSRAVYLGMLTWEGTIVLSSWTGGRRQQRAPRCV